MILFNPQTIAVIGASTDPQKIGHQIFKKLLLSQTTVIPINPKTKSILSHQCYDSVLQYPQKIDQAIVAVPAVIVPSVLSECVAKKIESVVIISAGFSETGEPGKQLEEKLKQIIKNTSTRVLGPNCLGFANPQKRLDITFAKNSPSKGNIALVSQSGAIGSFLFNWTLSENLGFSKFVSLGNRLDINENDLLTHLANDQQTRIIALYLESFAHGETFLKVASTVTAKKPVIVLFGGQTQAGKKATKTHTAALSPKKEVISTALNQSGCIEANSLEEFTDLLEVFSLEPPMKDNDLVIVTNAGGPSILATDTADQLNLDLDPLSKNTLTKLKKALPPNVQLNNPVDLLGDAMADRFKTALFHLTKNSKTDAYLIILSPQTMTEPVLTAKTIVNQFKSLNKPVIVSFLGEQANEKAEDILKQAGIATISFPQKAVTLLNSLYRYYHFQKHHPQYPVRSNPQKKPSAKTIDQLKNHLTSGSQPWQAIKNFIKTYSIPTVTTLTVTQDNLPSILKKIGFPLVLKSDPSQSLHRTEHKGLILNINSVTAAKKAFTDLKQHFYPLLAQPQLKTGHELFIGFHKEPGFPPMVTLGSGGIYTELYQDIIHCFLPLNQKTITQLLKQTKIGQIIFGYRGPELAVKQVIQLILNCSQMVTDFPQIKSLDINPAIITQDSIKVVDIKMLISANSK